MIKIITKSMIAVLALITAAGTANAGPLDIPDWTYLNGGTAYNSGGGALPPGSINAVTPTNILSTNGKFKYRVRRNGKVTMKYKTTRKSTVSLSDIAPDGTSSLGASLLIEKGKVVAKKGTITIRGRDPFGTSKKRQVLVTANYDESTFQFGTQKSVDGTPIYDLFGVSTFNIDCPLWDFCTTAESFYVAGDFGSNPDKIKLKRTATAVTTIPVPATVWLFGSGLLGLMGIARRKKVAL